MEIREGRYHTVLDSDAVNASGTYVELQDMLDEGWRIKSQERGICDKSYRCYLEKRPKSVPQNALARYQERKNSWHPIYSTPGCPA